MLVPQHTCDQRTTVHSWFSTSSPGAWEGTQVVRLARETLYPSSALLRWVLHPSPFNSSISFSSFSIYTKLHVYHQNIFPSVLSLQLSTEVQPGQILLPAFYCPCLMKAQWRRWSHENTRLWVQKTKLQTHQYWCHSSPQSKTVHMLLSSWILLVFLCHSLAPLSSAISPSSLASFYCFISNSINML